VHEAEDGWEDDFSEQAALEFDTTDEVLCPLSIAGSSAGINIAGLMKDLEMGFAGNLPMYTGSIEASNGTKSKEPSEEASAIKKKVGLLTLNSHKLYDVYVLRKCISMQWKRWKREIQTNCQ